MRENVFVLGMQILNNLVERFLERKRHKVPIATKALLQ